MRRNREAPGSGKAEKGPRIAPEAKRGALVIADGSWGDGAEDSQSGSDALRAGDSATSRLHTPRARHSGKGAEATATGAERAGRKASSTQAFWKRAYKRDAAKAAQGAHAALPKTAAGRGIRAKAARIAFAMAPKGMGGPVAAAASIALAGVLFAAGAMLIATLGAAVTQALAATSYTASDEDIAAADAAYDAMENALERRVLAAEAERPGFDEYRWDIDEIGHDPYMLASILTALYGDYDAGRAAQALAEVLALQYRVSYSAHSEQASRMVEDPETGEVREETYERAILTISLENRGLSYAASELLDAEQMESFRLTYSVHGNRDGLFQGAWNPGTADPGFGYDIPAEALKDRQFAAMMDEAAKYLGWPYVWGGSSPETSFDCSGFVCWVLNRSGTADVGRVDANGLMARCARVGEAQVKPGDLVFFQGTYPTAGASHVAIVVDPAEGIMIHAGDPISYASYKTAYWQEHFLAFGRINR